jgi:RNA polymerase sigma factor (sigma-70 family)
MEREYALRFLYHDDNLKGALIKMLAKNRGEKSDYDHLIHQTLIRFFKLCIKNKTFELETNYVTYILGIARNVWKGELNKRKMKSTETLESDMEIPEEALDVSFLQKERREILMQLLSRLGANCREVLMFWSQGYSMNEIAERMVYKSPGMAKKKKHICIKELFNFLDEHPEIKELLR